MRTVAGGGPAVEPRTYYVAITTRVAEIAPDVLAAHKARLRELHERGIVVGSGGFSEGGGLIIFDVPSGDAAEAVMRDDPFTLARTHTYVIRTWMRDIG